MNKSDLMKAVAERSQLSPKQSEDVINTIFRAMTDALIDGDRIEVRGFGSFTTTQYAARTGRNPQTGARIDVPPRRGPVFKPGKELRRRVDYPQNWPDSDPDKQPS